MSDGIVKAGPDTACTQPFLETVLNNTCQIAREAESQKPTNSTPQNWGMGVQTPRDIVKPKWHLGALLLQGAVPVARYFPSLQVATTME